MPASRTSWTPTARAAEGSGRPEPPPPQTREAEKRRSPALARPLPWGGGAGRCELSGRFLVTWGGGRSPLRLRGLRRARDRAPAWLRFLRRRLWTVSAADGAQGRAVAVPSGRPGPGVPETRGDSSGGTWGRRRKTPCPPRGGWATGGGGSRTPAIPFLWVPEKKRTNAVRCQRGNKTSCGELVEPE